MNDVKENPHSIVRLPVIMPFDLEFEDLVTAFTVLYVKAFKMGWILNPPPQIDQMIADVAQLKYVSGREL